MVGYKQVARIMKCVCSVCATVLKTKWPETWQSRGWWCHLHRKGKATMFCRDCKPKKKTKTKTTPGSVARKKRKVR